MNESGKPITSFINADSGAEIARQMSQEPLLLQAMGGLFVEKADLSDVEYILDLYCGPGSWALEMAFHHPAIEIIAIDRNPHMIHYARAQARVQGLKNVHFIVMDPRKELAFPDSTFDIVNARFIATFLYREEWPELLNAVARISKPEGIIRLTEADELFITNSAACERLKQLYSQALTQNGQSFHPLPLASSTCITPQLRTFLKNSGCQQIQERANLINYSSDGPDCHLKYDNLKVLFKLGQSFLQAMEVATPQELDYLYEQMLRDMLTGDFRALWYFLTCWGIVTK